MSEVLADNNSALIRMPVALRNGAVIAIVCVPIDLTQLDVERITRQLMAMIPPSKRAGGLDR